MLDSGVLLAGSEPVYVLGAGQHAKVVIATAQAAGLIIGGAFDDDSAKWERTILGTPVLGPLSKMSERKGFAVIAIGDNNVRKRVAEQFPALRWLTIVHPKASVHTTVRLGAGTVVFAGGVIQPDVVIGDHGILNTMTSVDHDCTLDAFVHLAPGVHLAGGVTVGEGCVVGVGASVTPYVSIGAWTTIGAGSAVVDSLPPRVVAAGVPARVVKTLTNHE
jgi:sugar O-acyltransferase (sialic acid O-acetyltransferase NeuD family)